MQAKSKLNDIKQPPKKSTIISMIVIWYASSIISSKLTYVQLRYLGSPILLSLFQQAFVTAAGAIILFTTRSTAGKSVPSTSKSNSIGLHFRSIVVLALAATFMSISYNSAMLYIPVSFLNTIKSTIPLWTSIVCWFVQKKRLSFTTQFSLIAIVGGVGMASATELGFHPTGFILGIFSAWNQTLFNLRAKTLLMQETLSPLQLQVFTAGISTCLLGFICLSSISMLLPSSLQTGIEVVSKPSPVILLTLCGLNYFVELRLSYAAIAALGSLGYSIADVFRRLILICSAVIIFGNPIQVTNILGVCIAMIGIFIYNVSVLKPLAAVKSVPDWASKKKLELPPSNRSASSPTVLFAV